MPYSRVMKEEMRPEDMGKMKRDKTDPYNKDIKNMQKQGVMGMMKMMGKTAIQMMKGGSPTSPPKRKMR